jgi:hypothetical protein
MKHLKTLAFSLCLAASAYAQTNATLEETLYYDYQKTILSGSTSKLNSSMGFTPFEQSLFVDALWDLAEEKVPGSMKALDQVNPFNYSLVEQLRLGILRIKNKRAADLPATLVSDLENALKGAQVDIKLVYTLAAFESDLLAVNQTNLIALAKTHPEYFDVANDAEKSKEYSSDVLTDLFYRAPDAATYMNGEYVKSVKIFMFCRENRLYPCLMTMRDIHGQVLRNADGTLWTHRSLASSKYGYPSYSRNGNTPAGIYTIDSVMPVADQNVSFGKFRRMILNFIPKSRNEALYMSLLPESSRKEDWWKASTVARGIGRNMFRIHGTGKINEDPSTPYFPFMRTSGCIAQRENTYDGVTFQDQRDLLDTILKAMDLEPTYENELKVKGIIYVYEIDDKEEPLTVEHLTEKGIE